MPDDDPARADDLVAEEGVNQQGTDEELAGRTPAGDGDGHESPGAAAAGGQGLLDAAPEPNEPA
jgi:hypothetical protein